MDTSALLVRLNLFLSLEMLQTSLYTRNLNAVKNDEQWEHALLTFLETENKHVENIRIAIEELGEKPHRGLDIATSAFGAITAEIAEAFGEDKVISYGIWVEQKAVEMYYDLVQQLDPDQYHDIVKMLWGNLVHEELHMMWFTYRKANGPEIVSSLKKEIPFSSNKQPSTIR